MSSRAASMLTEGEGGKDEEESEEEGGEVGEEGVGAVHRGRALCGSWRMSVCCKSGVDRWSCAGEIMKVNRSSLSPSSLVLFLMERAAIRSDPDDQLELQLASR